MISKYLRGEYGLPKSFWLVAMPFTIGLNVVSSYVKPQPGAPSTVASLLIAAAIVYLIVSGVYNSTKIYVGSLVWKYLSMLWCLVSLILFVIPIVFGSAASFGHIALNPNSDLNQKREFNENMRVALYVKTDPKNCRSEYKDKPTVILEYIVDVEAKKVITKSEVVESHYKKLTTMEDCIVVDKKNWSCGGKLISANPSYFTPKTSMIDGSYNYEITESDCNPKFEILK